MLEAGVDDEERLFRRSVTWGLLKVQLALFPSVYVSPTRPLPFFFFFPPLSSHALRRARALVGAPERPWQPRQDSETNYELKESQIES